MENYLAQQNDVVSYGNGTGEILTYFGNRAGYIRDRLLAFTEETTIKFVDGLHLVREGLITIAGDMIDRLMELRLIERSFEVLRSLSSSRLKSTLFTLASLSIALSGCAAEIAQASEPLEAAEIAGVVTGLAIDSLIIRFGGLKLIPNFKSGCPIGVVVPLIILAVPPITLMKLGPEFPELICPSSLITIAITAFVLIHKSRSLPTKVDYSQTDRRF